MSKIPATTNGNAPKEMLNPYTSASAAPGRARCPSGPATTAIFFDSIRVPRYAAEPAIKTPLVRLSMSWCVIGQSTSVAVKLNLGSVNVAQNLWGQHFFRNAVAEVSAPGQAKHMCGVCQDDVQVVGNIENRQLLFASHIS